jgi:hypothetical protein
MTGVRRAASNASKESAAAVCSGSSSQPNWAIAEESESAVRIIITFMMAGMEQKETEGINQFVCHNRPEAGVDSVQFSVFSQRAIWSPQRPICLRAIWSPQRPIFAALRFTKPRYQLIASSDPSSLRFGSKTRLTVSAERQRKSHGATESAGVGYQPMSLSQSAWDPIQTHSTVGAIPVRTGAQAVGRSGSSRRGVRAGGLWSKPPCGRLKLYS